MSELALKRIIENKAKYTRGEYAGQLNLSFLDLKKVPAEVAKLVWLEELFLNNNTALSNLPSLANLGYLKTLDCSNTGISDLTPILYLIKKGISITYSEVEYGNVIHVNNCPLTTPPVEVVNKGRTAILNYFAERSQEQFKNTEVKLILIGNSTVGKTSLSRYLRNKIYDPRESTTHGIETHRWQSPNGRKMEAVIWDFGGQEYYHATHRLFLSRNSVYALVWDAKTDKGGIEPTKIHIGNDSQAYTVSLEHFSKTWWVKNVHFTLNKYARHEREGDAPVPLLLVQNKCAAGKEFEEKLVPSEFEQKPYSLKPAWVNYHIDIAATANEQANGQQGGWTMRFNLFENELLNVLEQQMATYEFAVYHQDIRDRVRILASGENPVNEMTWTNFEALCRDIESEAKMDLVQIYLRDITGDILYFDQNERLKLRVFLRPDWVCNQIYAILSRKVLESNGLLSLAWVCEALQCDKPEALDFVELMREFQLIFEENNENDELTGNFVAPQYLPDFCTKPDKLEAAKEYANLNQAFTLWFPEILPKSHIARFVAQWGDRAKQRLYWKNGLLFKTDACTALVERLTDGDKIQVEIQNIDSTKRESAMRRIFQSFLDLEDGQPGFAISMNATDFARWRDVEEAMQAQAQKVKIISSEGLAQFIDIQPFLIFQKPVMASKVFVSYSKSDKEYLLNLKKQLKIFERQKLIEVWDDSKIQAGEEWDVAIKRELNVADIIILLVSSDFLATDYIWNIEMKMAIERHQKGQTTVIPIIVRSCQWESAPFGILNALPEKGVPVDKWENVDDAWSQVVSKIRQLVQ
jgi:internalin A